MKHLSLHRDPLGNLKGLVYRRLRGGRALETERPPLSLSLSLSLWELYEGNLEGGLLYRELKLP
jgi:hypothetical protein